MTFSASSAKLGIVCLIALDFFGLIPRRASAWFSLAICLASASDIVGKPPRPNSGFSVEFFTCKICPQFFDPVFWTMRNKPCLRLSRYFPTSVTELQNFSVRFLTPIFTPTKICDCHKIFSVNLEVSGRG